jgi:xanthine dehydrogenase molybdopterin-binding subunit B
MHKSVAKALGVPCNRVVVKTKRIGGGFGGKETRATPFGLVTAVAASQLGVPVRLCVDRDVDMLCTGQVRVAVAAAVHVVATACTVDASARRERHVPPPCVTVAM